MRGVPFDVPARTSDPRLTVVEHRPVEIEDHAFACQGQTQECEVLSVSAMNSVCFPANLTIPGVLDSTGGIRPTP